MKKPIEARPIGKETVFNVLEDIHRLENKSDKELKEFMKLVSMKTGKVRTAMDRLNGMEVR